MSTQKKIYIESSLCAKRLLDGKRLEKYFRSNGHDIVKSPKGADYIVLLTCGFRPNEKEKSLGRVKVLDRHRGKLIVGGCLPAIDKQALRSEFQGKIITTEDISEIDTFFPDRKVSFKDIPDANEFLSGKSQQIYDKTISRLTGGIGSFFQKHSLKKTGFPCYVRIGWGCIDRHCTYCNIWQSVGKLKSKPMETCLQEIKLCYDQGYRKFVLDADNPGAYGLDIGKTFADLLHDICKMEGKYQLQFNAFHPEWAIRYQDAVIKYIAADKISGILSPIQSGSNRILALMQRGYRIEKARDVFIRLRNASKKLKLFTHIIIGFPGETVEDFSETLEFIREINFDCVKTFVYERGNLSSDKTDCLVSEEEMHSRIKQAQSFFKKNKIRYLIYS